MLALGDLLTGFGAGQEADFVNLVDDGTDTTVQVDADGAADGMASESIAVLTGVSGSTPPTLASAGQIDFWLSQPSQAGPRPRKGRFGGGFVAGCQQRPVDGAPSCDGDDQPP